MAEYGFTTGSCAAAAAKAAAYMLLTGKEKENISIRTPKGIVFDAKLQDIRRTENSVSCAVKKSSGDDPDVTDGMLVYASASFAEKDAETDDRVLIYGGKGIGTVTKPGLDQPVGNAAINSTPRRMIIKEVTEVMDICGDVAESEAIRITISIPGGEEIAKQTFNPRLGIEGGISVLGTSGIVEPMSTEAIRKTIEIELRQKYETGHKIVPVSPGNYGLEFMKRSFGFDLDKSVKCSNFIGDMIDMAAEQGFQEILLTGHIGKLVKVAGGMMNTHSKYGDHRMEILSSALRSAAEHSANSANSADGTESLINRVMSSAATEDAVDMIEECSADLRAETMRELMRRIMAQLKSRAGNRIRIECMMYSNRHGLLAESEGAEALLNRIINEY